MAIPLKAILAPTIPYIGAFTSLGWIRWLRSETEVGSGGRRQRSVAEVGGSRRRRLVAEVGGGWWRSVRRSVEVGGGDRWRLVAEVGGSWWRRSMKIDDGGRSRSEVGGWRSLEVDVGVRISCGVVVKLMVKDSGFNRGVSIRVLISLFQFIFSQCLNSRLKTHNESRLFYLTSLINNYTEGRPCS